MGNLSLKYVFCSEGDLIITMTDGVHDNFDPFFHGLSPAELGVPKKWKGTQEDSLA